MSRLDELKKQYPELNLNFFDLMTKMDTSKTYKYLPLICKLFVRRFDASKIYPKDELLDHYTRVQGDLLNKGISTNDISEKELYSYQLLTEHFNTDMFTTIKDFIFYMEKNQIENKDVTSYSSIEELRGAITLASMKEFTKEMEQQVIKEYEDETWIAVRPLTFAASTKYGSGTRWCTTYQKEKHYFERYWRQGILCYFINKKSGYKFAGYKSLNDKEMSFWNADDTRIDFLDVNIEDYMFPNVKKIYSSQLTNKNLCSNEIQEQVHLECIEMYEKKMCEPVTMEEPEVVEQITEINSAVVRTMGAIPVYSEPTLSAG